jgi:hypothetical protein
MMTVQRCQALAQAGSDHEGPDWSMSPLLAIIGLPQQIEMPRTARCGSVTIRARFGSGHHDRCQTSIRFDLAVCEWHRDVMGRVAGAEAH